MVRYGSPAKRREFIKQRDEKDCGPACLCSICMHYGATLPLAKAREMAKSDLQGTSLYGMAKAALRRHLRHPERPKMPRRTSTTAFPRSYPTSAMRCLEGLIPRSSWPGPCMLSPTQWSPRCRLLCLITSIWDVKQQCTVIPLTLASSFGLITRYVCVEETLLI